MIDTLCRVTKRREPATVTPPVSACLMEESSAKSTKATMIDNNVRAVRSFLRLRLLQMRWKYFTLITLLSNAEQFFQHGLMLRVLLFVRVN